MFDKAQRNKTEPERSHTTPRHQKPPGTLQDTKTHKTDRQIHGRRRSKK